MIDHTYPQFFDARSSSSGSQYVSHLIASDQDINTIVSLLTATPNIQLNATIAPPGNIAPQDLSGLESIIANNKFIYGNSTDLVLSSGLYGNLGGYSLNLLNQSILY